MGKNNSARATRALAVSSPMLAIPLFLCLATGTAQADNMPRDYLPAPAGTNVCTLYYQYGWGDDLFSQGNQIASDYRLRSQLAFIKGTTYRTLGEELLVMQLAVPFADVDLDWQSGSLNQDDRGIGDLIFLAGFWPYSDPAKRLWWGVTGWVTMPTGEYDANQSVNTGTNRWAGKGETNLSYGILPGLYLEATAAVEFYSDNDSFLGSTLEQEPVLTLEGHLSKDLFTTGHASLDYFFHAGGETTLGGAAQDNGKSDHALQATVAFPIGNGWFSRLLYRNDFKVRNGAETQTVGLSFIKPF